MTQPPQPPSGEPYGQQPPAYSQQPPPAYSSQPPGYGPAPTYSSEQYRGQYPGEQLPGAQTTAEERNWAMAAHLGSFVAAYVFLGLLAPLAVLLVKGNSSAFVRRHAVESLNFQINALVYLVVFTLLLFLLIGFVLLPLYAIFYLVVVIIAGVRASRGEEYRYPMTIRFIS
jgi:hypothetical protein